MPGLNWEKFKECSGDVRINFENLCRGIVRAHFGSFGQFKALKNQPGVEYHINLSKDCSSLGSVGQWFGWQCKWFELNKDNSLKAASKADIEDSLSKTVKCLPNLTDWVLWTPFTLAKKDQTWFEGLESKYPFKLHLWAEEELDNWLSGPAEMLLKTYFGELVLSFETLKEQHDRSIAPIKDRWLAPVHQVTNTEAEVRRALATPTAYRELETIRLSLEQCKSNILKLESILTDEAKLLEEFIYSTDEYLEILNNLEVMLAEGDIESLHEWLASPALKISDNTKRFVRVLRRRKLPIALDAANALDDMFLAKRLFESIDEKLKITLIAVLADAGGGKTQLSAQLSSANKDGIYGIYIQGKFLNKTSSLDSLANKYKINGTSVGTFEELVFALNAAGQRAKCRLPIVIDGLNEAEDPRVWKDELASLLPILENAKNVLVVCTLRTGELPRHGYYERKHVDQRESFAVQALPSGITKIEMDGFGEFTTKAIRDYLSYYKIDAGDTELPINFFKRPITLRIYCEVTNPDKSTLVKVNQFPTSLPEIFGKYIDYSCKKISEMSHLPQQYSEDDIRLALYYLGQCWWESNGRDGNEKVFKKLIQDDVVWDACLVNLLSQEGIIFRNPGDRPGHFELTPVYDALGGFLIADFLIQSNAKDSSLTWFNTTEVLDKFGGDESHFLSSDIFRSLTSLVPKHFHGTQLWTLIPQDYKVSALLGVTEIEPKLIDAESVEKIKFCFSEYPDIREEIFPRLRKVRSNVSNPLNSSFLSCILNDLSIKDRDLYWTEWLRKNTENVVKDVEKSTRRWKTSGIILTDSDCLLAEWLMWILSTTNRTLRDNATKALYEIGRHRPNELFELTLKSSTINDPYIFERMLAASYGVSLDIVGGELNESKYHGMLAWFVTNLFKNFYLKPVSYSTHFIIRKAVNDIVLVANKILPVKERIEIPPSKSCPKIKWGSINWDSKLKHPFHMDFENYTIGRLIPERGNYNYDHPEYKHVKEQMLWRVLDLGWSDNDFSKVDSQITSGQHHHRISSSNDKVDRYGKKYSWIAYDEIAGVLIDQGKLEADWDCASSEIDFSFPVLAEHQDMITDEILELDVESDSGWLTHQVPEVIKTQLISVDSTCKVLLDGLIEKEVNNSKRKIFVFVRGYLIKNTELSDFIDQFKDSEFSSNLLPEKPDFRNTSLKEYVLKEQDESDFVSHIDYEIGSEQVEMDAPLIDFVENEDGGSILIKDSVKRLIDKPIYKSFECELPSVSISRDVGSETEGSVRVLNKKIITACDLKVSARTFDLCDQNNEQATWVTGNQKNSYTNHEEWLYIRKDLLDNYLKNNEFSLVSVIWGERSLKEGRHGDNNYTVFHDLEVYYPLDKEEK